MKVNGAQIVNGLSVLQQLAEATIPFTASHRLLNAIVTCEPIKVQIQQSLQQYQEEVANEDLDEITVKDKIEVKTKELLNAEYMLDILPIKSTSLDHLSISAKELSKVYWFITE